MGTIANLMVEVGAHTTEFTKGMGEVNTKLSETGAKSSKFGSIMGASGLLAAGAFTGIVAFAGEAIAKTTEAGQAAFELSEKFGLAKGTASAYLAVGQQLGLSGEQIGKSFQFLSKNVSAMQLTLDAGGHISAATGQAYKELGINVLDAGGKVKSADALMLESADAFAKMEDGPVKAALAMKLFGKSGTDLLPMLNQGSAGIKKLMEDGKAAGVVMGGEQVDAAHKAFLAHKQLDTAVTGLSMQLGTALLPSATKVTDLLTKNLVPALAFGGAVLTAAVLPAVIGWTVAMWGAGASVIGAIPGMIAWTASTWAQVVALGAQAVAMVAAYWPILLIIGGIALLVVAVVLIVKHWDFLKAKTLQVWSDIKTHVLGVVSWFQGVPGMISAVAGGMWNGIWNAFKGMLNKIVGAWNSLHFTIGGGSFAGVSVPSITLGVPQMPYFHTGGLVPGSGNVLAMLQGGERVIPRGGDGGLVIHNHFDLSGALITEGPVLDVLVNKIVNRLTISTGR